MHQRPQPVTDGSLTRTAANARLQRLLKIIAAVEKLAVVRAGGNPHETGLTLLRDGLEERSKGRGIFRLIQQNPSLFRQHPRDGMLDVWQLCRDWDKALAKLDLLTKHYLDLGPAETKTPAPAPKEEKAEDALSPERKARQDNVTAMLSHGIGYLARHRRLPPPSRPGRGAAFPSGHQMAVTAQGLGLSASPALKALIQDSGLFDHAYYRSQFRDGLADLDPIEHYMSIGWRQGKDPNPLFSSAFYQLRMPILVDTQVDSLTHYIQDGSRLLLDPHPLFDSAYFAAQLPEAVADHETLLGRFLHAPVTASPHPLFEVSYYAAKFGSGDAKPQGALLHYLIKGWRSGLDFSPYFRGEFYKAQCPEEAVRIEPYTHYRLFGCRSGLDPHPLFDSAYYVGRNAEVDPAIIDPLTHFLKLGEAEGHAPSHFFDPQHYTALYRKGQGPAGAFRHFLLDGAKRDLNPSKAFDSALYRRVFMAGAQGEGSAVEHFLTTGLLEVTPERVHSLLSDVQKPAGKAKRVAVYNGKPGSVAPAFPSALGYKQYPGKVAYVPGQRNVMVVAHVAAEHLFGSERSFLDMLEGLAHVPANIFVVLPRNVPDYTNLIRQKCHMVSVVKYGWWRKDQPASDEVRAAFRTLIDALDINAVHANTIMLRECLEAARDRKIPGIVHAREVIALDEALVTLIGQPVEDIITEVLRRSDWVIGNSQITADTFFKPGQTFVIPNTVNDSAFQVPPAPDAATIRFGLISSNLPKKGLFDVVRLARLAAEACPVAEFVIIGPETDAVRQIKQEQAEGKAPLNVVFPGYAADPAEAIAKLHVILNFSHFAESFGRTILEAMAAARPVIAYEWGALPELIRHGTTGYLVPYGDAEAALPFVIGLCAQPALLRQLGDHGQVIARQKYGLPQYREGFGQAYRAILPDEAEPPDTGAGPVIRPARLPGLMVREAPARIAYFCWHFPVPSETFVLNELEQLVRDGYDVRVFCKQSPHKTFSPSFAITHERVTSAEHLAKRLAETGRTIVHAHFTYPTVTDMVWPACEAARIPFTFIAHAQDIFKYDNDRRNRLSEIAASPWCRKIFTLSRFHHDFLVARGVPSHKVVINPNAVDTTRFASAWIDGRETRRHRRVVAVHRFVEKKGLALLIGAGALIADMDVTIHIYGYGPLEEEYRRQVSARGLTNVIIHGAISQDEVIGVMQAADLFASPSVRTAEGDMDGIPTSIVESMAAGVPVLATTISGIPDLVIDGVTGMMAEPRPDAIADAIRRFYAKPDAQVKAMIGEARRVAVRNHDVKRLVRVLSRVWENRLIDILIVSWNNLLHLRAVVERVVANTALPYHLIICDNQSMLEPVRPFLDQVWAEQDRVTIIHNDRNAMVGPGTNLALAQSNGDYAIYLCGKEGISFANGWEIGFVHGFEDDPEAGLIGTIGRSPTYLVGEQYPQGIPLFSKFRNQDFALTHKDRIFGHIQGGLFGLRRRMVDEIGGFSEDVPHDYTDVEYSYYAESRGWKLGEIPGVLALFNKSRPTLSQRFDENILVAHPVLPHEIARYDGVRSGKLHHCNICDWFGDRFHTDALECPGCGCGREDRTLFRWLSESPFLYRRLPALALGLSGRMEQMWKEQFQGPSLSVAACMEELGEKGRLKNSTGGLRLGAIRLGAESDLNCGLLAGETGRLLKPGSLTLVQGTAGDAAWPERGARLTEALTQAGFRQLDDVLFAGKAVQPSYLPILVFEKPGA